MEKDDEIAGSGNSYTAEYWQYDSRLGRRWNVDPVIKYHESSYAAFANNPIWFIDPSGADSAQVQKALDKGQNFVDANPSQNGDQYIFGKNETNGAAPGIGADCSGFVTVCVEEGNSNTGRSIPGDSDSKGRHSGVLNIQQFLTPFERSLDDAERGHLITFYDPERDAKGGWPYHIGIIEEVNRDEDGFIISITYQHSAGSRGPTKNTFNPMNSNSIMRVFKWDHIPNVSEEPRLGKRTFSDIERFFLNHHYGMMNSFMYYYQETGDEDYLKEANSQQEIINEILER